MSCARPPPACLAYPFIPWPPHPAAAWQDLVAYRRQQEADAAALDEVVQQHMQRWRLRRMLRFWQAHGAGCAAGRQALQRMAAGAERRAVAGAFAAWRTLVAQRHERLASLTALVAARRRQNAQQAAFQGWRLQVDDSYGARLQAQHAQQVLGRLRLRSVLRVSAGGQSCTGSGQPCCCVAWASLLATCRGKSGLPFRESTHHLLA